METVAEKAYDLFHDNDKDTTAADTPDKVLGKMDALNFAGRVELKKCVTWAKEQFEKWTNSATEINP